MQIQTALDWQEVSSKIHSDLHSLGYNPDLQKMFSNVQLMVTELSKLEVDARRNHNTLRVDECLVKINEAIDRLEKLLLIAKLIY